MAERKVSVTVTISGPDDTIIDESALEDAVREAVEDYMPSTITVELTDDDFANAGADAPEEPSWEEWDVGSVELTADVNA